MAAGLQGRDRLLGMDRMRCQDLDQIEALGQERAVVGEQGRAGHHGRRRAQSLGVPIEQRHHVGAGRLAIAAQVEIRKIRPRPAMPTRNLIP